MKDKVVVIGGGVSGLAAAFALTRENIPVVLLEKEAVLGGVAASTILTDGRKIPIGYHHILGTDKSLLETIDELGLSSRIKWKPISLVASVDGRRVDLSSPFDIMMVRRLPFLSKLRYCLFGARCLLKSNWQEWEGKSIDEFISAWTDEFVLKEIFEPLVDIKFGLSSKQVDAAWLGQRLHKREAATRFGYLPNTSWTFEVCQAFKREIEKKKGKIILEDEPHRLVAWKGRITQLVTKKGRVIKVLAVLSTIPPPIITPLLKKAGVVSSPLEKIKYISSYSLIAGLPLKGLPDYWTVALHPRRIFGACFNLSALNETLITKKDASVVNLFTNVPFGDFRYDEKIYIEKAKDGLSEMVGQKVKFNWVILNKLRYSTPIFDIDYSNPPVKLAENLYCAGIYCAFPKIASTGQAIQTGKEAALKIISDLK